MLECIAAVEEYTKDLSEEEFETNQLVIDAVFRNLVIVGDAARHVPREIQERHPEIPWAEIRGARNIMIHEYHGVDLGIIWRSVQERLPTMVPMLKDILAQEALRRVFGGRRRFLHRPHPANRSKAAAPPSRGRVATPRPARRAP